MGVKLVASTVVERKGVGRDFMNQDSEGRGLCMMVAFLFSGRMPVRLDGRKNLIFFKFL